MPGRASKVALAAGFAVVLALAIGLAQMTGGAPEATTLRPRSPSPATTPEVPVVERPAPGAPPTAAREHPPVAAPSRAPPATPVKTPELASPPVSFTRDFKRDANGNLVPVIPVSELRERLPLAEPAMKACVARSGQQASGKATLNFTVGAKNNTLLVETTGVQDEETLAAFPDLLECMHRTANVLLPDGRPVPELGTGIYVRRHVRIENGQLVEDSLFNFSYHQ